MKQGPPHPHPLRIGRRLFVKLTASVGLSLMALAMIGAVAGIKAQERSSVQNMLSTATWFSDTVKRATRYAMLRDQRESVHRIIKAIGEEEGVEAIRVFNKSGNIMFSTRAEEVGHMVDMQAEACFACHQGDKPLEYIPAGERSRIFSTAGAGGHRVVSIVNPIYTEPACYTDPCHVHPPGQKVLGVLDVGISLAQVDREIAQRTGSLAFWALLMLCAAAGLIALFTGWFLNRPLNALVLATRRISSGDYDHPVSPMTTDEIGDLAWSFEIMRQGIKDKAEALEESRRRYQTLFEQVPCYVSVLDRDYHIKEFNSMLQRDFGVKKDEFCFEAYKWRKHKCFPCVVEKTFADGRMHSSEEVLRDPEGNPRRFLNLTSPLFDKDGNITAVMEMATDITDLRKLEDELRKSEEKYRLFFNNDPNPILVFDAGDMVIFDANQRAAEAYGQGGEPLVGSNFLELMHHSERQRVTEFLERREIFLPNVRLGCSTPGTCYVNLRASYGEHLGRQAVIATTSDVTEHLKAQQQLIQASKMATLGEMSAGVAHELNQPLSVIATGAHYLQKRLDANQLADLDTFREVAAELRAQVERASCIINHLRQFGRKSELKLSRVSVAAAVKGTFHLLGRQLEVRDISVVSRVPADLPAIMGDQNRMEQVFINLLINARDAITQRRAQEPDAPPGLIELEARVLEGRLEIRVADNGAGLDPELAERIFEPFFTTKEPGKGTGLGLSISYSIIGDFGGEIRVEENQGGGAVFVIDLPLAPREEA